MKIAHVLHNSNLLMFFLETMAGHPRGYKEEESGPGQAKKGYVVTVTRAAGSGQDTILTRKGKP